MIFRAISIIFAGSLSAVVGFWTIDREPPTVIYKAEVLQQPIKPGEDLKIKYTIRRTRSCEITIDRTLYDADLQRVILDDIAYSGAPGPLGESAYVTVIPIPRSFASGIGTYRVINKFVCNPLHRIWPIIVHNTDVTFAVEGPPVPSPFPTPVETLPRR